MNYTGVTVRIIFETWHYISYKEEYLYPRELGWFEQVSRTKAYKAWLVENCTDTHLIDNLGSSAGVYIKDPEVAIIFKLKFGL